MDGYNFSNFKTQIKLFTSLPTFLFLPVSLYTHIYTHIYACAHTCIQIHIYLIIKLKLTYVVNTAGYLFPDIHFPSSYNTGH